MPNDIAVQPLVYNGEVITQRDTMLSLTSMWKASGSNPTQQPSNWLASAEAQRFIGVLKEIVSPGISGNEIVKTVRGGRSPGSWAHWQVAMAYAKYLSPEFHMWCNTVVRERMEGQSVSIATLPPEVLEMIRRDDGISRQLSGKVKGIETTIQSLVVAVAAIAAVVRAPGDGIYVTGRTAGEIWKAAGFPPIKITSWFSNRLAKMGCQIEGERRVPVGTSRAKLFDPDKAENWLRNGGRILVEEYVAKRMNKGQTVLRLVQPGPAEVRPTA